LYLDQVITNYDKRTFDVIFEGSRRILKSRLIFEVDEANVLLKMFPNSFSSLKDPEKTLCRPLFTCMMGCLSSFSDIVLVAAGTRLDLKDTEYWESLIAKTAVAESPRKPEVIHDLPLMQYRDMRKFIKNIFEEKYIIEAKDLWTKMIPSPGRFRYLTSWIDTYVSNQKTLTLTESMKQYLSDLIDSKETWSMSMMIENFVTIHGTTNAHHLLKMFVARYLAFEGIIKDTVTASWMSDGFCRCTEIKGELCYKIDEPFVIQCIQTYFKNKNISMLDYLLDLVVMADYAFTAGLYMDKVIACCFLELSEVSLLDTLNLNIEIKTLNCLDSSQSEDTLYSCLISKNIVCDCDSYYCNLP
jgi:hypothetical protein